MKTPLPVAQEAREDIDPIDREAIRVFLNSYAKNLGSCQLLILIPAYNEEGTIAHLATLLPSRVEGLNTRSLVLIDGATDLTAARAREFDLLTCDAPINRGQGAALKMGYKIASLLSIPYIAIVDADGQWDPNDISRVVKPLIAQEADFVQGSRVLGSTNVGDPVRDIGVVVFAKVVTLLTGKKITDTSSGIRAFTTSLLGSIRLQEPQYQSSELLISAFYAGARIVEVPVVMSKRTRGKSKKGGNLKYGSSYAKVVFRTWVRERFRLRL